MVLLPVCRGLRFPVKNQEELPEISGRILLSLCSSTKEAAQRKGRSSKLTLWETRALLLYTGDKAYAKRLVEKEGL